MATFTSRRENLASREASRTSHALTRSSPPPMQAPWTAAITGTGQAAMALKAPWRVRISARSLLRFCAPPPAKRAPWAWKAAGRSSPYENALALDRTTTTRTSGSCARPRNASSHSAKKTGGMVVRSSVTVAT